MMNKKLAVIVRVKTLLHLHLPFGARITDHFRGDKKLTTSLSPSRIFALIIVFHYILILLLFLLFNNIINIAVTLFQVSLGMSRLLQSVVPTHLYPSFLCAIPGHMFAFRIYQY